MDNVKKPFHETVAEKLIEQLQEGTAPWQKPWRAGDAGSFLPMNPITGKRYKGINAIQLMSQGFDDQRWMTYKQAAAVDAQVRKGEKGTPIQYWKFREEQTKTDAAGKPVVDAAGEPVKVSIELERPKVFFATVFNAMQIDGLAPLPPRPTQDWAAHERAENILISSGAMIHYGEKDRAFYRVTTDSIHLPEKSQFVTADAFYATALHELGHWTGHATRLARDLAHPFGSEGYAKEELRAEIASMILGDELGIGHDPAQHAAYVGSWIKLLRNDPLEIFRAAADAEKIQGHVLGLVMDRAQTQSSQLEANMKPEDESQAVNVDRLSQTEKGAETPDAVLTLVVDNGDNTAANNAATRDDPPSPFRTELERLTQLSWLEAMTCTLRQPFQTQSSTHPIAAVFVGDTPVILCGGADEPEARELARSLSECAFVKDMFAAVRRRGPVRTAVISPRNIEWKGNESVISFKGFAHVGAIVLEDPSLALSTMLCVTTDTARIIDPTSRELDDGWHLVSLAMADRQDAQWRDPQWREVLEGLTYLRLNRRQCEANTLDSLDRGTLARDMAAAERGSLVGVWGALNRMSPHNLRNEFWRQQPFPTDIDRHVEKVEAALVMVEERLADVDVAKSRLEYFLASGDLKKDRQQKFFDITRNTFDVHLPLDWDGGVVVTGGSLTETSPEHWRVWAQRPDGKMHWVADCDSAVAAETLAIRLEAIAAHSNPDEDERTVKLVRVHERSISRDPRSTAEAISAARELRVEAELEAADARIAAARLDLTKGIARSRLDDGDSFDELARTSLGFGLPHDWTGGVHVQRDASGGGDGTQAGASLSGLGTEPESWSIHAERSKGTYEWLADLPTQKSADDLAARLLRIAARSTIDEFEKAAKAAQTNERQVRQNPHSTSEDISVARAARNEAEFSLAYNDADLQRRIDLERERLAAASDATTSQPNVASALVKVLLDVPYKQKEEAKALGAKWDRREQSWYVPIGVDVAPLAKWAREAPQQGLAGAKAPYLEEGMAGAREGSGERAYLAVPYGERSLARSAGAKWDKTAKSWYAGAAADMAKLERWKPENVPVQQGPAMTPQEEFAEALRALGCVVSGEHPIMDGQTHRITVQGEKHSKNAGSGFYVGHLDGHPAGYIKNNKTSIEVTWKAKGYTLDPEQKARMAAEAADKLQAREAEQNRLQEIAVKRLELQLQQLVQIERPTPYLVAKGIKAHIGALTDKGGQKTYVPVFDVDGKLWSIQYIQEDGTKRFAKNSRMEGCFHAIGGIDKLKNSPALVIAEGYATAAILAQTLGFATVAAFNSGNLQPVAMVLHAKFPDKPIIIAGDDDRHLETTSGINPGRLKATEAAAAVSGTVLLPIFAPHEMAAQPKEFTDFNDLATKSELGLDGIDRQVRPIVDAIVERHRQQGEQTAMSRSPGRSLRS